MGSLGRDLVAKASPDGYTLLIGDSPHTINVHVLRHVPYDPIKDFTPITLLATAPQVLVINPGTSGSDAGRVHRRGKRAAWQAQLRLRRHRVDHAI